MASYIISVSAGKGCYRHIQINQSATLCDILPGMNSEAS